MIKRRILASLYPINIKEETSSKIYTRGDQLIFIIHSKENRFSLDDLPLEGIHNTINSSAAISAALILGLNENQIKDGLSSFQNAPHRMEKIISIDGVQYINDSKATNVESTYYALDTYKSIIWIAGGIDKGNDYGRIKSLVRKKVKALICLGVDNDKLTENFDGLVPLIEQTTSMENTVKFAEEISTSGDTVLLSPACASFDLFNNYEERGETFKKEVLGLKNKKDKNEVS